MRALTTLKMSISNILGLSHQEVLIIKLHMTGHRVDLRLHLEVDKDPHFLKTPMSQVWANNHYSLKGSNQ
jgi:hypothetical protein